MRQWESAELVSAEVMIDQLGMLLSACLAVLWRAVVVRAELGVGHCQTARSTAGLGHDRERTAGEGVGREETGLG